MCCRNTILVLHWETEFVVHCHTTDNNYTGCDRNLCEHWRRMNLAKKRDGERERTHKHAYTHSRAHTPVREGERNKLWHQTKEKKHTHTHSEREPNTVIKIMRMRVRIVCAVSRAHATQRWFRNFKIPMGSRCGRDGSVHLNIRARVAWTHAMRSSPVAANQNRIRWHICSHSSRKKIRNKIKR